MHRFFSILIIVAIQATTVAAARPNLLLITVDDMNADSMGSYGCPISDLTPQMDAVVRRGLRFQYAHVQVGNCMPGRNTMWSGLFPHNHRVEGFYQVKDASHPHLVDVMNAAGYFTAIRGKASHSTPFTPYDWDKILESDADGKPAHIKDAASYGGSVFEGISAAAKAEQPFCLMINISDPHKPFFAQAKNGETIADKHPPSRVIDATEVPVPGFLFDDPVVRKELAHYYSSVRRADDCVGAVMNALKESGQADQTIVMFLSDHGMALPFAKTQLYHHSTHTPLAVSIPGVTSPDTLDSVHMVSAVDLLPTIVDLCEIKSELTFDGRSFASVLKGKTQIGRDHVIKEYNENAGGSRDPMRGIQTKNFLYLFNAWSNGTRVMATATTGTPTYRRLKQLAAENENLAARHTLYQFRVPEEFFDVRSDPDCLINLIDSPQHQATIAELRETLLSELRRTGDPIADVFADRDDAAAREAFVVASEAKADDRRAAKRKQTRKTKQPAGNKNNQRNQNRDAKN